MAALKIVITVLMFQIAFAQRTSPPPIEDDRCPEDQNNCSNNSYCYIYSVTNQSYCAESCELNNGGCGTDRCVMVRVQCFTAPCPPVVNCRPPRSFNRSISGSVTPTRASRSVSRSRSRGSRSFSFSRSISGSVNLTRPTRSSSGLFSTSASATSISSSLNLTRPSRSFSRSVSRSIRPTRSSGSIRSTRPSRSPSGSRSSSVTSTSISSSSSRTHPSRSFSRSVSRSIRPTRSSGSTRPTRPSRSFSRSRSRSITTTRLSRSRSPVTASSTIFIVPTPSATPATYTCSRQPESGPCLAYFPSYFYNVTSRSCQMFVYGGCGGNDNRFSTFEECSVTCRGSNNICGLAPETGWCEAYIPSYFYNATSEMCEMFIYGGCGGNPNRFSTLDQCKETCGNGVCGLQPETGNCRGSFPRYYYNKLTRKCELFVYGGCGGNGNRFSDVSSCEDACISSEPTVSPTPVVSEKDIITITIGQYDGDIDGLVTDFTSDLVEVLTDNGIKDISIKIVDILYTSDNHVILSLAVYSDERAVSGDKVAALINNNKETFTVAVSDAIVGDGTSGSADDDNDDGLSRGAVAGIVIGIIVGLILITLLVVVVLYFVMKRPKTVEHTKLSEKSDGMNNPIYTPTTKE